MIKLLNRFRGYIVSLNQKLSSKLVVKLIFLFTSIIIAVVISLTFISYEIMKKETIDQIITSNTTNLRLVNKNFEKYFHEISQNSFPYAHYDNFMNAVANESDDYVQRTYLEEQLKTLISSYRDINSVYLYIPKQNKYYYTTYINNDLMVNVNYGQDFTKLSWYKKLMDSTNYTYIQSLRVPEKSGYEISGNDLFIVFHRVLRNIADRVPMAVVTFSINSIEKNDLLNDLQLKSGERVILMDASNRLFYTDLNKEIGILKNKDFLNHIDNKNDHYNFYYSIDGNKYLVIYDISDNDNWKLIKLIPYSQVSKSADINSSISISIGAIFVLLSVILVLITSSSITKPLKKLSKKMTAFGKGDFDTQVHIKGNDEIAHLSDKFNEMVVRINDLVNEQYKMKLVEKNAILKALEAELNPHFLYNALQAISTKALKSEANEVGEMIDALALTFRYCINGVDVVKVKDEIKHIENYLKIQKARYGDRLEVVYDLEDAAMEFDIPKLSIQCLVENSIKHALETMSSASLILVRVESYGSNARIIVKDNGPGIDEEKLNEITESMNHEWTDGEYQSIGLKNLNTRLKLIFGDQAEITIKSDEHGTETSIIIPERRHSDV